MSNTKLIAGLALGSLVTLTGCANNPFEAKTMNNGYSNSAKTMEGNCSAKVAEGNCSAKKAEGNCSAKKTEGSCAAHNTSMDKKADANCAAKAKTSEGTCAAHNTSSTMPIEHAPMQKMAEGKCSEAKCGG